MVEIEAASNGRLAVVLLEAGDEPLVRRMYDRLSAASLYRRFFSPPVGSDRFVRAILRVDALERVAVAAVEGGEVVGLAQYSRRSDDASADLGLLIADGWQKQGLGTRLVAALADRASAAGIARFSVDVQGDNHGALRLLRRVAPGLRLVFNGGVGSGSFAIGGVL